jgi:hypothetical protein
VEALEAKQPLSAAAVTAPDSGQVTAAQISHVPNHGYLVYRITNPNIHNNHIVFPVTPVLVQGPQPVPGEVYNLLFITVRNGTAKTFDASSGFRVKISGQSGSFPVMTGNQQWLPGQWFGFYVLTKKYYPLQNPVTDGFIFDLGNARSVGIPGPSGIFLRLKYNPATFDKTFNTIIAAGQGSQGGAGFKYGLPVTSLYEFLSAKTRRIDFGGYF